MKRELANEDTNDGRNSESRERAGNIKLLEPYKTASESRTINSGNNRLLAHSQSFEERYRPSCCRSLGGINYLNYASENNVLSVSTDMSKIVPAVIAKNVKAVATPRHYTIRPIYSPL